MGKLLLFAEQRNGQIKKASLEAISTAFIIAKELNSEIECVLLGNEIENISVISDYGIENVKYFKNPELAEYSSSAYTKIITDLMNESGSDILFVSNTALGRDLAPRVAARIDAGLAIDCTEIKVESGELIFTRPIYAGKALLDFKIVGDKKVISIRPNVFPAVKQEGSATSISEINEVDVDLRCRVSEIKKAEGKLDVAEADIIVSGGRGMKGPEHFALIEELADSLGAATGASRAVVDAGWRPHSEQVGQTGKTVSPSLYIAVGISGAIQHLAGMRSSKYIVAVNKDSEAPIFQVADYGITGDAFEILPPLIEEIKKIKEN